MRKNTLYSTTMFQASNTKLVKQQVSSLSC